MPETIGQQLKAARERRNLTFAKVTQATHIQARLLEAMEADDFEKLPSPVQGRAFLRLYAGFLELSLEDMIARQRQASGEPAPALLSDESAPNQALAPVEVTNASETAEEGEVKPADQSFHLMEKIKGLLLRFRKPLKQSGQLPEPVEPTQLSLPLVDHEPISSSQADPIEAPADEPEPFPASQAAPVEVPVEEPVEDWQDEPPAPAWRASELQGSQSIFTSIGQSLRQRRESLSLTLDEIERHTHVRNHYLQALELGDFDHLPSSVQTRGMLNNYAHFLDMDVDAILLQFAEGLQAQRLERQPTPVEKARKSKEQLPPKANLPTGMRRYLSMDILVGGGLILVLIAFAIWGTNQVIKLHSAVTPQSTAQSISEILAGSSGTATLTPTPSAAGTETVLPTEGVTPIGTIPAAGPGPVQVVVVALREVFLRVTVDGKSQFDGRITAGAAYSFSGNNQIEVLTGNGAGISILFNQGNLGPMGRYGEVVDRIYTANAILNPTPTNTPTKTITPTPTTTPRESPTPSLTKTPLLPPAITP
jgi:cytoskeleton protein RodZ